MVIHDVERGHALARRGVGGQLDQTLLLQQQQRARFVGIVSGNDDGRAVRQLGQAAQAVCVDAERLIVDLRSRDQLGAVGGVEALEIRGVLEVVRVKLAVVQRLVRQHVVIKNLDLERPAVLGEGIFDLREDLGVRR